jgi:DNA transposition AAA+ family ATPase
MSIRTFIFCDICNPQATRAIEYRRSTRLGARTGRRISDGRAWIEASLESAVEKHGWRRTEEGLHVCPACQGLNQ